MRGGGVLLIDTGPDLRLQALRERLLRVDGVYTHTHADHPNGIDDLRNYCYLQKQAIPVFGNELTINNIRQRFGYAFGSQGRYWDKPVLTSRVVAGSFEFAGAKIAPIPLLHGRPPIFGYRINNMAYFADL